MNDIQLKAIQASLDKMKKGGHFSICTITDILKVTQTVPDQDAMDMLKLLHCVKFSEMDSELLRELPTLIQRCILGQQINFQLVATIQPATDAKVIEFEPVRAKKRGWLG